MNGIVSNGLTVESVINNCRIQLQQLIKKPVRLYYSVDQDHLSLEELSRITIQVCEISWSDIISKRRDREIVVARHLFCFFARRFTNRTVVSIGKIIGRDHTSVVHATEHVNDMIQVKDDLYYSYFKSMEKIIKQQIANES